MTIYIIFRTIILKYNTMLKYKIILKTIKIKYLFKR